MIRPDGLYQSQQRFGLYRWHIIDPIRFEKDLQVTIQALGWRVGRPLPAAPGRHRLGGLLVPDRARRAVPGAAGQGLPGSALNRIKYIIHEGTRRNRVITILEESVHYTPRPLRGHPSQEGTFPAVARSMSKCPNDGHLIPLCYVYSQGVGAFFSRNDVLNPINLLFMASGQAEPYAINSRYSS